MFNSIAIISCMPIGQQFDKNGNVRQWLSNCTIAEFQNRTQCFINQYNSYYIKEINKNVIAHGCHFLNLSLHSKKGEDINRLFYLLDDIGYHTNMAKWISYDLTVICPLLVDELKNCEYSIDNF